MKITTIFNAIIPIIIFGAIISASACKKTEPAKSEITVVDKDGNRIENATVYINCTPGNGENNCILSDTQQTDNAGKIFNTYDHPAIYGSDDINFAVLQVEAFKEFDSTYTTLRPNAIGGVDTFRLDSSYRRRGEIFIELKVNETASETVTIVRE